MRYIVTLLLLAALLLLPISAQATTWYVGKTGSDSNTCTQAQSDSTPKLTVTAGISCLVSCGDVLLVKSGTYVERINSPAIPSCASWATVTRIAADTGQTVWLQPSSGQNVLLMSGTQAYIEFDGINLDGTNVNNDCLKIDEDSSAQAHHIRWTNATCTGAKRQGIVPAGSINGTIGGNEFTNCVVHSTGSTDFDHGFYVRSSNNLIENCEIYDIIGGGIHLYHGSGFTLDGNRFIKNRIHSGRFVSGERGWGIIASNGSSDTEISNNIIWDIPNVQGESGCIRIDAGNAALVYNNLSYNCADFGIRVESTSSNTIIRNNIACNNGTNYSNVGVNTVASNNLTSTCPDFLDVANDNFRPVAGASNIDTGTTVALITDDFDGVSRPQNSVYDIGPFELEAGAGDTTDPSIVITAPTDQATYNTPNATITTIAGTCADDVAVDSVTWSCDVCGSGTATGTTSWSIATISLMEGANVVTLTCTDTSTNTGTDQITVTRTAPGASSFRLRR